MIKKWIIYITLVTIAMACQSNSKKENHNTHTTSHQGHQHGHEGHTTTDNSKVNYDCRHCGMPSQEYPKWKVKVVTEKGPIWYCSPRCMFISVKKKDNGHKGIKSIDVISYYATNTIDAKTALYVTGSDILGPMGHDLVPLKDKAAAKDFKNEHKGQTIVSFDDVNMKIIQALVDKE